MDPLLSAILQSRDPSRLVQEMRPEWAVPLGQGRPEVSAPPERAGPPLPARMQETRDVGAAAYERGRDPLNSKRSFFKQAVDAILALNDQRARDELPSAESMAIDWWNPNMGMVGMLAGKGAKTAPLGKLKKAIEAEARGVPSQEIWRKYGWERGTDKQWRWEMSDEASRLSPAAQEAISSEVPFQGRLGDAWEHPELFKAYPNLADTPITLTKGPKAGSYMPTIADEGSYVKAQGFTPEQVLNALHHEGSHGVAEREGFAAGSSPAGSRLADIMQVRRTPTSVEDLKDPALAAYWRQAGEVGARNDAARMADPDLKKLAPSLTEDVPRMLQIIRFLGGRSGN